MSHWAAGSWTGLAGLLAYEIGVTLTSLDHRVTKYVLTGGSLRHIAQAVLLMMRQRGV